MGIGRDFAEAILREHWFQPIAGDVVTVGRQRVDLSPAEAVEMMQERGIEVSIPEEQIPVDQSTLNRLSDRPLISDVGFFGLLGARTIKAMDHSDYEGAEIIHNLSTPVPDELVNSVDVLIDGSTLDNVFDPASVLTNYARMLRRGGRLMAINHWTPHACAYVLPSPVWFLDYFVYNAWADCKVYLLAFVKSQANAAEAVNAFYCDPSCLMERGRPSLNFICPHDMATFVIAEKGADSTADQRPTQQYYRSAADIERYRRNLAAFALVPRPHIVRSRHALAIEHPASGHLYIDHRYQAVDPEAERARIKDAEFERLKQERQKRESELAFAEQLALAAEENIEHRKRAVFEREQAAAAAEENIEHRKRAVFEREQAAAAAEEDIEHRKRAVFEREQAAAAADEDIEHRKRAVFEWGQIAATLVERWPLTMGGLRRCAYAWSPRWLIASKRKVFGTRVPKVRDH
jgi:hypothetical protein